MTDRAQYCNDCIKPTRNSKKRENLATVCIYYHPVYYLTIAIAIATGG